jgi:hypothetical protein
MLDDISRLTHKMIRGHDESWCSFAYRHRHFWFWRAFVWIMGDAHCERSWRRYHKGVG